MEKEKYIIKMEILDMTVILKIIYLTEMENYFIKMEKLNMKVNL